MNVEAKEQHIGRLQQENKQARRNYMNVAKNADTSVGNMVGTSLINKLNFQGVANSTTSSTGY